MANQEHWLSPLRWCKVRLREKLKALQTLYQPFWPGVKISFLSSFYYSCLVTWKWNMDNTSWRYALWWPSEMLFLATPKRLRSWKETRLLVLSFTFWVLGTGRKSQETKLSAYLYCSHKVTSTASTCCLEEKSELNRQHHKHLVMMTFYWTVIHVLPISLSTYNLIMSRNWGTVK